MTPERWREVEQIYEAALERAVEDRPMFLDRACGGDSGLREEVESLLDAQAAGSGFLESPALAVAGRIWKDHPVSLRFGPYRVVRELGHGGMGTVYLAERDDGQYTRRVAVKVVGAIGSPELLQRFDRERQILAALDHPHIARLEDAGLHSGTPYLVMELVQGQPLSTFCDEHRLDTAARCQLFVTICRAVHHAHRHLVIHRDLKPSNILVTEDGTPKLLDFGIAKLLASDRVDSELLTSVVALTPAYASPEQMTGKPLTTASDIYSLGVLLYELLAGKRPFQFRGTSVAAAAEIVSRQSPARPSVASGRSELAGDLDSIVLRAISPDADERYSSAEDLAGDLENHLAGRPVKALPPNWHYVARKFLIRHRRAALVSAAVFLAFAGVFTMALVARRTAVREREIATRRFNHLRKLAVSIINEFDARAAAVPGNLELRKLMVARSSEYLNLLAKEDLSGDPGLVRELADSFIKLGDILGNITISNLGDTKEALRKYQQARSLLAAMLQRNPGDTESSVWLGRLLITMSSMLARDGQQDEAKRTRTEAYMRWEALLKLSPQEQRALVGFADACFEMALRAESPGAMVSYYNRALEIYEQLARQDPANDRYRRNMALVHKYLASVYLDPLSFSWIADAGANAFLSPGEALRHLLKAEELDVGRVAAHPENRNAKLDLSFDLSQLGTYEDRQGNYAAFTAYFERVVGIRRELWLLEPKDVQARSRLAFALSRLAAGQARMGRFPMGWQDLTEAVEHWSAIPVQSAESPDLALQIAWASFMFGTAEHKASKPSRCRGADLGRRLIQKAGARAPYFQKWIGDASRDHADLLTACPQ